VPCADAALVEKHRSVFSRNGFVLEVSKPNSDAEAGLVITQQQTLA